MPHSDPEKRRAYHAAYSKKWDADNIQRRRDINRVHDKKRAGSATRVKQKADVRQRRHIRERIAVIEMYGGKCKFCPCTQYEYLTLDHVQGDGKQHRLEIASKYRTVYDYLLRENIIDHTRFRLLCWNCHMALTRYNVAPGREELHDMDWWRDKSALRKGRQK